ncbi:SCO family protein [Shewanella maritima]|uniref:SCO family protein n=1 Tax=Shewanella maritima TaxID=2520507 RepID=UPI003734D95C
MTRKQVFSAIIISLIAFSLVPLLMWSNQWFTSKQNPQQYGIDGSFLSPLHFEWQDTQLNSQRFPFNEPTYTYVFAGFLSCSEICPIRIKQLHQLEAVIADDEQLSQQSIAFLFITIDPDNDTPQVRQQVIDAQSPRFFSAALAESALFKLSSHLSENISSFSTTNNHVGKLFLIKPNGEIGRIYSAKKLSTDKMLAELKQLIYSSKESP